MPRWQCLSLFLIVGLLSAGLLALEGDGLLLWSFCLAVPFFFVALIRVMAVRDLLRQPRNRTRRAHVGFDDRLPTFSVLVPLHRETVVVPSLVRAMKALDYPTDLLEILFITEAGDEATYLALLLAGLAPNMSIVVVPPGEPKTKPRALNFALQTARGALVSIYDAEDAPDADQLRVAAQAFVDGGPSLACVQARLAINNADASFWTRQFANEYTALFGGLLPALQRLGLALPLGGTSNHFRRDVLLRCGGWDPFNVTEDADLGIRLARLGYEVSVIDSVTMEEAPSRRRVWLGQRTRWIKGWTQTYLVHMRRPTRLLRDLGAWRFWGFQVTIGGMLASLLVHPWFYALVCWHLCKGEQAAPLNGFLLAVCTFNLGAGYGAAILLSIVAVLKEGMPGKLPSLIWLPLYWLAISYAAYRAVLDLIFRPFYWEKTAHGEHMALGMNDARRKRPAARRKS